MQTWVHIKAVGGIQATNKDSYCTPASELRCEVGSRSSDSCLPAGSTSVRIPRKNFNNCGSGRGRKLPDFIPEKAPPLFQIKGQKVFQRLWEFWIKAAWGQDPVCDTVFLPLSPPFSWNYQSGSATYKSIPFVLQCESDTERLTLIRIVVLKLLIFVCWQFKFLFPFAYKKVIFRHRNHNIWHQPSKCVWASSEERSFFGERSCADFDYTSPRRFVNQHFMLAANVWFMKSGT